MYMNTKEGAETTLRHFKFVVDSSEVNRKKIPKPDFWVITPKYLAKQG